MIGRDLLTPDEVRKMDNSKCLIFIRGFDPIMDDKFHTLESDEFALSTSLGMYDALEKSYRYQLENYGGIFKESNVFSHLEETQDGLYKIPFEYGGYMLKYESGQAEVLPAFDSLGMVRIHAGGAVLSKIPVCGYYEEEMYTELTEEQEKELFVLRNRMTPAKRNLRRNCLYCAIV